MFLNTLRETEFFVFPAGPAFFSSRLSTLVGYWQSIGIFNAGLHAPNVFMLTFVINSYRGNGFVSYKKPKTMKRYFFLLFFSLLGYALHAQDYRVSTEPQKQDLLMEVFTGVKSDAYTGLVYTDQLKQMYGDRLNLVLIHAGSKAYMPDQPEFDYRVEVGQEISKEFFAEMTEFANASFNRKDVDYINMEYIVEPLYWIYFIDQFLDQTAPVNLWAEAEYDGNTHEMKIEVEGYCRPDELVYSPCLQVMVVQNNVTGYQNGAPGERYEHQHMLRHAITGNFGEPLNDFQPGSYFRREYTYKVPEKISAIPVKPEDLELVFFVSQYKNNVVNSITVKPKYKNVTIPLQGRLYEDSRGLSDDYCLPYLPFDLENRSDAVLTSARFNVSLNGKNTEHTWTGEIPAFSRKNIQFPIPNDQPLEEENNYVITLLEMNGQPVEPDTLTYTFRGPGLVLPTQLVMTLHTNNNTAENSFTLHDIDGGTAQSFGPYEDHKYYEEKMDLIPGHRYYLDVTNPKAHFEWLELQLCDTEGKPLVTRDHVTDFGYRIFFRTLREGEQLIEKCKMHIMLVSEGELFINGELMKRYGDYTFNKMDELHLVFRPRKNYYVQSLKINDKEYKDQIRNNEYRFQIIKDVDLRLEFGYMPTGIDETAQDGFRVYTEDGRLVLEGLEPGQAVNIYTLEGKLIFHFEAQSPRLHLDLPQGQVYIVQTNGESRKVTL